jgi:hypothetical protein
LLTGDAPVPKLAKARKTCLRLSLLSISGVPSLLEPDV